MLPVGIYDKLRMLVYILDLLRETLVGFQDRIFRSHVSAGRLGTSYIRVKDFRIFCTAHTPMPRMGFCAVGHGIVLQVLRYIVYHSQSLGQV